jgi:hypothetical protein
VVVPEAAWLLVLQPRLRRAWLAVAFVAACGGGLLPLLIAQSRTGDASWISKAPLNDRLGQVLPQFLVGTGSHAYALLMWLGFVLGIGGFVLLGTRGGRIERGSGVRLGLVAVAGFALVMAVDATGSDTVLTRNLLGLWLPLAIALAAGLGARRAGRLGVTFTAALCALGLTATVSVATDSVLQRPDWAAVARALGPWPRPGQPADAARLLVFQRNVWLESLTQVYMVRTAVLGRGKPHHVTEIDIVANSAPASSTEHWLCWWGAGCNLEPSRLKAHYALRGFHPVSRTHVRQFTIQRLVSDRPRRVHQREIVDAMRGIGLHGTLIQHS